MHSYSVCTRAPRVPRTLIEIQYMPIQFVLELQGPEGFFIEIQFIPTQFVLELQEPQRNNTFLFSLY